MPNLHANFLKGQVSVLATAGATTIESASFTSLPAVAGSDRVLLTLDPDGTSGAPEVVEVTAHSAGATTVTVVRGRLSTVAREHAVGTPWIHGLYAQEFDTALSDISSRVAKTGDTMTGALTLAGAPTSSAHAASKGYVDTTAAAAAGGAWTSWTPTVQFQPFVGGPSSVSVTVNFARYQQVGKTVDASLVLTFAGTSPAFAALAEIEVSLPVAATTAAATAYAPIGQFQYIDSNAAGGASSNIWQGMARLNGGVNRFWMYTEGNTEIGNGGVLGGRTVMNTNGNSPINSGDKLYAIVRYEVP